MPNAHSQIPGERPGTPTPPPSRWERISLALQIGVSMAIALAVMAFLIWSGTQGPTKNEKNRPTPSEAIVKIVGQRSLWVRPDSKLFEKLAIAKVESNWVTAAELPVTGTVLASLRPGKEKVIVAQDTWQFATPDLLTAYSDWQRAVTDVQFQGKQLELITNLNEKRIDAQKKVVKRKEDLVKIGTETEEVLAAERTNLIQFEIQGRKEIHEAETAEKLAKRTEATLARQLQQAGLEPNMLRAFAKKGDIVVAEVPERVMGRVRLHMMCEVRFFGIPDYIFHGKVSSISPVISKERRTLNVQFIVDEEEKDVPSKIRDIIRPGMFAEIGVGTDKRKALLMPVDGVLHVGDKAYVLEETAANTWQITEVQIGELLGTNIEIVSGVSQGSRVLGLGAILLKPEVVRALQNPPAAAAQPKEGQ